MTGAGPMRSLLFVPANRPQRIAKAVAAGPDGLLIDLEDAVPRADLPAARAAAAAALRALPDDRGGVARFVRVNRAGDNETARDLDALVGPWLDGVMLPKAGGPEDVVELDRLLTRAERRHGLPPGRLAILPLVESCRGLKLTSAIATASVRVCAMALSSGEEGDLVADLGGRWTPDGLALSYARGRFLADVRAAGDLPAIDGVCMSLRHHEVLRSECELARTFGYDGKLAIHPAQLAQIHATFRPSGQEVRAARDILDALAAAAASGRAVAEVDGRMVDAANARLARRVLARAGTDAGRPA